MKMARAKCGHCGETQAVKKDGMMLKHYLKGKGGFLRITEDVCPGSGHAPKPVETPKHVPARSRRGK